jgi:hypothetical protein
MSDIIKEFLVSLSYSVKDGEARKFATSIAIQTEAVRGLSESFKEVSIKLLDFSRGIVESMNNLYFSAQRTGASAQALLALGYAADTTGSSANDLASSLQGIQQKIRELTPKVYADWLTSMGVHATDANGKLLSTDQLLINIKKRMDEYNASGDTRMAKFLGDNNSIGFATQMANTADMIANANKELAKQSALGLDPTKLASQMKDVENLFKSVQDTVKLVGYSIASDFAEQYKGAIESLDKWLIAHLPEIRAFFKSAVDAVGPFIAVLLQVGGVAATVIGGLMAWFNGLDPSTKKMIASWVLLAGVVAAGLVAFAAVLPIITAVAGAFGAMLSPVGLVVGAIALLAAALTHVDWGPFKGQLGAIAADLSVLWGKFKGFVSWLSGSSDVKGIGDLLASAASAALHSVLNMVTLVTDVLAGKWSDALKHARMHFTGEYDKSPAGSSFSDDEKKYGLPSGLLDHMYSAESGRGKYLRSSKGALGPFQFLPGTAAQYGLTNPDDLNTSADAASRYMRDLLKHYMGNQVKAVAAYNWGPTNVDKFGLVGAPKETHDYINKVLGSDYNPYTAELIRQNGASGADNSKQINIHQTNTTTVTGSSDPTAVGAAVGKSHIFSTEQLIRDLRGKVL